MLLWIFVLFPLRCLSLSIGGNGKDSWGCYSLLTTPSHLHCDTRVWSAMGSSEDSNNNDNEFLATEILFEHAKEFDSKLASGDKLGDYSDSMWSNRLGTVLTPVAKGVYTADRPFYWNQIDVGGRMCVIQLDGSDLWVHSPVKLDEPTKIALKKLGNVRYIVSPNYEHLKYAKQWSDEYPDAFMWGCPGLSKRLRDIEWQGEIPFGLLRASESENLENCWKFDVVVPLHLDMEMNPFNGKPFFNEVIFYHQPSKSLLTTDVYWNYPQKDGVPNSNLPGNNGDSGLAPAVDAIPIGTRLWKFGMDRVYLPFYKRIMIRDKRYYDKVVNTLMEDWDIHILIPCHGDIIRGKEKIREVLARHFSMD